MTWQLEMYEQYLADLGSFAETITVTEDFMAGLPQTEIPVEHSFAEGLYCRKATGIKDTVCITRVHKHENFAFIMTGDCSIVSEHGVTRVKAPQMFKTDAGTKRLLFFHEESVWFTVHAMPPEMAGKSIEEIEEYFACNTLSEYEQYLLGTQQQEVLP